MPRGRHEVRHKTKKPILEGNEEPSPGRPAFTSLESDSPLVTLLFVSKASQHAALSRIEAFYESTQDQQIYLTLEEARQQRQCQHYEAFNFPMDVVRRWLACMQQTHHPMGVPEAISRGEGDALPSELDESPWYKAYCNEQEYFLLQHLHGLGVLEEPNSNIDNSCAPAPVYLISTLASQQASLRHERLHFLYFISPSYRDVVKREYDSLSAKALKIIQQDLKMRRYSEQVWIDEFQAYVSEDAGEFGNSVKEDCLEISRVLRSHQATLWKGLKVCY